MASGVRFAAVYVALLVAFAFGGSTPAAAQASPGEYRTSIDTIYLDIRAMWGELDRFKVEGRYCNPSPPPPSKAEAQARLAELERRAQDLNRRYNALKQSLLNFLDHNHRLYSEMMVNGRDPRDRQWWSRDDNNRQRMIDELARKKTALAAAPEVDCRPKPKPKPVVATGGGFQAPAIPVRPSVTPSVWPALPARFCSYDEKIEFLKKVGALLDQAGADAERAARARTEVEQAVNHYVQNDRPVPPELIARRRQAIADVEAANRRAREANDNYNRANAIPVIDCRQPAQQEPPRTEPTKKPQWAQGLDEFDESRVREQQRILDEVEKDLNKLEEMAKQRGACEAVFDEAEWIEDGLDDLEDSKWFPAEVIRKWQTRLDDIMHDCPPARIGIRLVDPRPVLGLPPPNPAAARILDIHNKERAQYRMPPLQWDARLAANAAAYAGRLAAGQPYEHASRSGRETERENLSMGYPGSSAEAMMQNWLREKRNLKIGGIFPDVSLTGNWKDAGHYSQMIWATTTHVGCGTAQGKWGYLVCRYAPPGNQDGRLILTGQPPGIARPGDIAPPNSSTPMLPRDKMGGGMVQIDPPPPPPPTARDDAPEGKEENHPLVRYAQAADAQHAVETDCGNAPMARLELEKMRYALDELKKRLKAARQAGRFSTINPDDVQRQVDDLERRIRDAEQRRPRPRAACPPPPPR